MTDPAPAAATPEDELIVGAVFTPEGALRLLERVAELEAHVPATVPAEDDDAPLDLVTLNARLDRHRRDIEAIKTWCKGLSEYLGLPTTASTTTPAAAAGTTPESYQ